MDTIVHWWVNSMTPIAPAERLLFYVGLLLLCLFDRPSPLHAPDIIGRTERLLYTPPRFLTLIGVRWVKPSVLSVLVALTIASWVGAALGLLQPLLGLTTFLGFAFLHAVNAGALGSNHSTHSALYALFCLTLSVSSGPIALGSLGSLDIGSTLVPPGTVFQTGFARRLLLTLLVYVMFAAGVSKVRYGGPGWLNGRSLQFYIARSRQYARWPWFADRVAESSLLCRALAAFAMVVELSALFALWNAPARALLIGVWVALHVGILLVMMPAYWVQMWCYTLVVEWPAHLGASHAPAALNPAGGGVATASGCILVALLCWALWRQVEAWPLTVAPMYSNAHPPDEDKKPTREALPTLATRAAQGDQAAWKRAWVPGEAWEDVRAVRDGTVESLFTLLENQKDIRLVRWSQYAKVLRGVAINEWAARRAPAPLDAHASASVKLLRSLAHIAEALPSWGQYDTLQFVCRTDRGWEVVEALRRTDSGWLRHP